MSGICQHAASGCDYPVGDCAGLCATTDGQYADLLARLNAMPAQQPARREQTRTQERRWLLDDLLAENGEATW
jgi:hypothetical protein